MNRTRARRRRVAGLAVLGSLLAASGVRAAASIPLTYEAPAGCPSAPAFERMVAQRLDGAATEAPSRTDERFAVTIKAVRAGLEGAVQRAGKDGAGSEPRVIASAASDCQPLAGALALTVALSLTTSASTTSASVVPDAASTTGEDVATRALPASEHARRTWAVGAGAEASGLLPPVVLTGGALFVENGQAPSRDRLALARPDLRLTVAMVRNDLGQTPTAARFTVWTAALEVCPVGAGFWQSHVAWRLCARGQVGRASGEGIAIDTPQTGAVLFSALGALTRLRVVPGRRLFVEVQGGAVALLRRPHFVFAQPRVQVASAPAVAWLAGFTAGVTIP